MKKVLSLVFIFTIVLLFTGCDNTIPKTEFGLNEQAKILSTSEIDDVLYDDTMALIEGYEYVLCESFTTQSTDENIRLMSNKFVNSGDKFAGLLQSKDKGKFVNDTTDEDLKYDYQVVMRGLGLSGRL